MSHRICRERVFLCASPSPSEHQALELRMSLGGIESITSVPCARHGPLDVHGGRIDLQLPDEPLSLRGCVLRAPSIALLVDVGVRIRATAPKPADGKNVLV